MSDGSLALCNMRRRHRRACAWSDTHALSSALRFLDKRLLLSISMDFTLRLWDTPAPKHWPYLARTARCIASPSPRSATG